MSHTPHVPLAPRVFVAMVLSNHVIFLSEALQALAAQTMQPLELRFINNGMPDASVRRVQKIAPSVAMLHNARNRGWGVAWDQAAQLAVARWGEANDRYLCLLSSDTFPDMECFERLTTWMDTHPDVVMASPILLHLFEEHGNDEAWQERVESDHVASAGLMWKWPGRLRNKGAHQMIYDHGDEVLDVDAVAPGCVFMRLSALNGSFDSLLASPAALVECARRMQLVGGRCVVVPRAVAYRYSGRYRQNMPDRILEEMDHTELLRVVWRRLLGRHGILL